MKYTQKPISIFPNNLLLQSHEILHFLSFHMNNNFLNVFKTSQFCPYCVPDIPTWSYQTSGFHLLITSWHIFPVHHFTLAPFFAFSLICLSYINKSFIMIWVAFFPARNCYELPSSWSWVTSFPMKTLNCHISRTRHTKIPVFALRWDLVSSILYTKNHAVSSTGTLRIWPLFDPFDPTAAARGRW